MRRFTPGTKWVPGSLNTQGLGGYTFRPLPGAERCNSDECIGTGREWQAKRKESPEMPFRANGSADQCARPPNGRADRAAGPGRHRIRRSTGMGGHRSEKAGSAAWSSSTVANETGVIPHLVSADPWSGGTGRRQAGTPSLTSMAGRTIIVGKYPALDQFTRCFRSRYWLGAPRPTARTPSCASWSF